MYFPEFQVKAMKGIMQMFGSGYALIYFNIFHSFECRQSIPSTPIPFYPK
jgi:hypothetical protein